jgi:undecaprenyl-diphosphatase
MLLLVGLMTVLVPIEPLSAERRWAETMQDLQSAALKDIALVFNALGRGIGLALTLAAIALLLLMTRRWLALLAFAVTEALTPLISLLLKAFVDRPRPPDGLIHPVSASFPSGHTAYAGATCVALVLLFSAPGPGRRLWWTLAGLGIIGMAWSRTYLQVHWLTDVIAGALLGIGIAILTFAATQYLGRAHSFDGLFRPSGTRRSGSAQRAGPDQVADRAQAGSAVYVADPGVGVSPARGEVAPRARMANPIPARMSAMPTTRLKRESWVAM